MYPPTYILLTNSLHISVQGFSLRTRVLYLLAIGSTDFLDPADYMYLNDSPATLWHSDLTWTEIVKSLRYTPSRLSFFVPRVRIDDPGAGQGSCPVRIPFLCFLAFPRGGSD